MAFFTVPSVFLSSYKTKKIIYNWHLIIVLFNTEARDEVHCGNPGLYRP